VQRALSSTCTLASFTRASFKVHRQYTIGLAALPTLNDIRVDILPPHCPSSVDLHGTPLLTQDTGCTEPFASQRTLAAGDSKPCCSLVMSQILGGMPVSYSDQCVSPLSPSCLSLEGSIWPLPETSIISLMNRFVRSNGF